MTCRRGTSDRFMTVFLLLLCLLACAGMRTSAAQADSAGGEGAEAEWTVMIYLCGTDLESKHGFATYNLEEMAKIVPQPTVNSLLNAVYDQNLEETDSGSQVRVVLETGGCAAWQAEETLGMQISSEALQRWSFTPVDPMDETAPSPFMLEEELPLASMGDPGTLADFIRWSAEHYPARKYGLVLWDHGGGSLTGVFLDELFENDIMYLNELGTALEGGGVHFETVILDACLMANLETAVMLAPHAEYMVASEEESSGYGSAFGEWLRELYLNPACGGREFGYHFCNVTQQKYADMEDEQARELMTFSVIDLSKIDALQACFDEAFTFFGRAYENYPILLSMINSVLENAEHFGSGKTRMVDIGSILYQNSSAELFPREFRSRMLKALSDAVVYSICGDSRTGAHGLSFCYAANVTPKDLDIYAANCKSAPYLAYLDAISDWEAPQGILEETHELPELADMPQYRFETEVKIRDGLPVVAVNLENYPNMGSRLNYEFYRYDEAGGNYVRLGIKPCWIDYFEEDGGYMGLGTEGLENWPAIEGETLCDVEFLGDYEGTDLYSIPLLIDGVQANLRCGFIAEPERSYRVYGLWSGYDANTGMPNRNVLSLSAFSGREYQLCYPVFAESEEDDGRFSENSGVLSMYRSMEIEEIPLPPGEYAVRYVLTDLFGRKMPQEMIHVTWDGTTFQTQLP